VVTVSDPVVIEPSDLTWPEREGAVHQPRRAIVAVVELVVAGLLVWLAMWLWREGVDTIGVVRARPELTVDRYQGNWIGGAVAVGAVASILVLDALRQLILAVRSRSK
jgi:hypothetical protein